MTKTIEQKALIFIDENHLLDKGDKVLVALSGGADSIFLFSFLQKFKRRFGIELTAFHLNHLLRGKTAKDDEKFCVEFCANHKIELIRVSKDVKLYSKKMKVSFEEAGREIRYSELNKAAEKFRCNKIATAHNASDNVETLLLNFFKGTGIKGMSGIPIRRENIIRPILCLSAEEIRKYLKQIKIPFRVDESNLDSDFERNFLRNEIIPKLKQRLNPRIEEKIINTSKIVYEINSYIEKQIETLTHKYVRIDEDKLLIETSQISKLDKSFLSIFLKFVIEKHFKIDVNSENIFSLVELLKSQTGKEVHLKENIIATRERNTLVVKREKFGSNAKSHFKIKVGQRLKLNGNTISINKVSRKLIKFNNDKSIEFISGDGLRNVFELRKWKTGDKFHPIGMNGTKKISDFLSDVKASSIGKKDHFVLTNGNKIVWVIGLRIDDRFKVTNATKKILKLTLTEK